MMMSGALSGAVTDAMPNLGPSPFAAHAGSELSAVHKVWDRHWVPELL